MARISWLSIRHMCAKSGECEAGWAEPLPPECPHPDASDPASGSTFYRLVKNLPPLDPDFYSYEKLGKKAPGATPCQMRSVSLCPTIEYAHKVHGLPSQKHENYRGIVELALTKGTGVVRQGSSKHIDWWKCSAFDAISASTQVAKL
jgi:hypothetical protein